MSLIFDVVSKAIKPYVNAKNFYVAYSGGIDSHVLLHLCAKTNLCIDKLTAVHVNHGLQALSDTWVRHCAETARKLQVNFVSKQVNAQVVAGQSPEETARIARYRALVNLLDTGDLLLVAHHREDNYETVLLQMLRGAGLAGLSAMPEQTKLGRGILLRPLLNNAKHSIEDYARKHKLHWIEDASNQQNKFDRNYIRNKITPLLKARWPSADKTIHRVSQHCVAATKFIAQTIEADFLTLYCSEYKSISIAKLLQHNRYLQQLMLRRWFQKLKLRIPSMQNIQLILDEVVLAKANSSPQLHCGKAIVRRYRDSLYCQYQHNAIDYAKQHIWPAGQTEIHLPENGKIVIFVRNGCGIDASLWQRLEVCIRYRQGGERIRLPKRNGSHSLKNLFQEAGVPPWQRPNIPLIFMDNCLIAIPNKWISSEFYRQDGDNIHLRWHQHKPTIHTSGRCEALITTQTNTY